MRLNADRRVFLGVFLKGGEYFSSVYMKTSDQDKTGFGKSKKEINKKTKKIQIRSYTVIKEMDRCTCRYIKTQILKCLIDKRNSIDGYSQLSKVALSLSGRLKYKQGTERGSELMAQ